MTRNTFYPPTPNAKSASDSYLRSRYLKAKGSVLCWSHVASSRPRSFFQRSKFVSLESYECFMRRWKVFSCPVIASWSTRCTS